MTGSVHPWMEIEVPTAVNTLNVRRANVLHSLDYWFGRDLEGRYLLCFDFDSTSVESSGGLRLSGIAVEMLPLERHKYRFVLTLQNSENVDVFQALCMDLMGSTAEVTKENSAAALVIILNRLRRWQSLLERVRDRLLSRPQLIGLVGELMVLRDLLLPRMDSLDAVQSWRGPYGDEQDFLLVGSLVEVKSQLSTSDGHIPVSSEHQLDTRSGPIIVCHQTLDLAAEYQEGASSLNQLVSSMSQKISSGGHTAMEVFWAALLEAGYWRREEYDTSYWLLNRRSFYEVVEGFPRLTAEGVGVGIDQVQYRISLSACTGFEISEESAVKFALNA